jgi:predicted dehydrogenase
LEAGKHDYCEWALGRTTSEADELTVLAKTKGRGRGDAPSSVGQDRYYAPHARWRVA